MATATAEAVDPLAAIDQRITIPQAARRLGVHSSTCWRWIFGGVSGIRLETFFVGGKRYTSENLLRDFLNRRNALARGEDPDAVTPTASVRRRRREIRQADADNASDVEGL